jgi:hypothetical protein
MHKRGDTVSAAPSPLRDFDAMGRTVNGQIDYDEDYPGVRIQFGNGK